jgi:predicted nucleotidyltransferase
MTRDEVLRVLSGRREELRQKYGVKSLALFGSMARDEAAPDSDVDLLVEFEAPPGFDGYMDLKYHLEERLGCRVDLVMKGALTPDARPVVEQEAVDVP